MFSIIKLEVDKETYILLTQLFSLHYILQCLLMLQPVLCCHLQVFAVFVKHAGETITILVP